MLHSWFFLDSVEEDESHDVIQVITTLSSITNFLFPLPSSFMFLFCFFWNSITKDDYKHRCIQKTRHKYTEDRRQEYTEDRDRRIQKTRVNRTKTKHKQTGDVPGHFKHQWPGRRRNRNLFSVKPSENNKRLPYNEFFRRDTAG